MTYPQVSASVAPDEVARFSDQSGAWWQPDGPFRALHELGPLRLRYIQDCIKTHMDRGDLKGLRILDLGCGGGLMAEALAALGAKVTGVDAAAPAIAVAKEHAAQSKVSIDYRVSTAEELARSDQQFDVITALEIVEHVADLGSFLKHAGALLAPGGLMIIATMNRTKRSFLLGVVAAEYVLGWVAPGTHDWDKFVKPTEMVAHWERTGIKPVDLTGLVYKPLKRTFAFEKGNAAVNYFMTGRKEKAQ